MEMCTANPVWSVLELCRWRSVFWRLRHLDFTENAPGIYILLWPPWLLSALEHACVEQNSISPSKGWPRTYKLNSHRASHGTRPWEIAWSTRQEGLWATT
jgi:hypothetical protein